MKKVAFLIMVLVGLSYSGYKTYTVYDYSTGTWKTYTVYEYNSGTIVPVRPSNGSIEWNTQYDKKRKERLKSSWGDTDKKETGRRYKYSWER